MARKTYRKSKTNKSKATQYTALIPKTLKATKNVGKSTVKKINYFFNNTTQTLKRFARGIDKKTARSIRSLTRRRARK
jgi:hypothetical protein